MATLDELIKARLEERRQEKIKAEQERQEELAEQERQEELVVDLFAKWLEHEYDLDATSFYHQLEAKTYSEGFEAHIHLSQPEEYPMVAYTYPLTLNEVGDLEAIKSDDPPWEGWRSDEDWASFDNLIDAVIYALNLEQS